MNQIISFILFLSLSSIFCCTNLDYQLMLPSWIQTPCPSWSLAHGSTVTQVRVTPTNKLAGRTWPRCGRLPNIKRRLTTYNLVAGEVNESYGSGEHGHRKSSCNPGPPENTTQAVLVSFRDIVVSVCIIIHNPPSYYMLHHCTTDPHALKSYCAASITVFCAFLPMHSWNVHAIVRRTCSPPACGQPGRGSVVDLSCWAVCGRLG